MTSNPRGLVPAKPGRNVAAVATAIGLLVAVVAWIATGGGLSERVYHRSPFAETVDSGDVRPSVTVRVADSAATDYQASVRVTGWTRASRTVSVRSEVRGRVEALPIAKGEAVETGTVLARISMGDRAARRREALAAVRRWQLEVEAGSTLASRGYNAKSALANAEASLESARAELAAIEKEIADTTVTAPFAGVLDRLDVEIGDLVETSGPIGLVADLDPIVVHGSVSERDRAALPSSRIARARFLDGTVREGRLRYVSSIADPRTRTFPVEVEIDNPDGTLVDGLTAEITIPTVTVRVHLVPASVIGLDPDGRLGVKLLSESEEVRFVPVRIEAQRPQGVLVSGLPERCRIIVVGQEYVHAGETVPGERAVTMREYLGSGG